MHIVQLANFYGASSGGLRTVLDELGRRYAATGHRVTRIVPGEDHLVTERAGAVVISVRAPLLPRTGGYRTIVDVGRVDSLVASLAPDVIELSDKTTLVRPARLARERGVPVVLLSHERLDAILAERVPRGFPLASSADRWNQRLASTVDAIVCASAFSSAEFSRVGAAHVARVPLGVDLDVFSPRDGTRQRAGDGVANIACVGRLSAEKRPRSAVLALRELARRGIAARLFMVGDGPERSRLERLAAGLDVVFTGHVRARAEVAAILRSADVAIAPCPFETFGLGALEALACGTPIVVPRSGALAELLVENAGAAVADHPIAFASGIEEILRGSAELQRIAARRRAEQFGWDVTAAAMTDLFQRLAPERSRSIAMSGQG